MSRNTPILRSLHWFEINECIEYKLLSLTCKVFTTNQPDHLGLHNLISVQSTSVWELPEGLGSEGCSTPSSRLQTHSEWKPVFITVSCAKFQILRHMTPLASSDWRDPWGVRPRTTWLRTIDDDVQPQNFVESTRRGGRQGTGTGRSDNKSSVRQRSVSSAPPRRKFF